MAVRMSASTLVMLTVGLLGVGLIFEAERGIVAMAMVWLAIYPVLLVWGARFVARSYALNLRHLARSMAAPLTATAAMVAAVELVRLLVTWSDPHLQVALAFTALGLTYAGMFLYSRWRAAAAAGAG